MKILLILLFPILAFSAEIDKSVAKLEKITGCELLVTSGYRSRAHNKRVGGAKNSYHLTNRARDLVPKELQCVSINKLGKTACELISTIIYKNHIHVDLRENKKLCWKKDGK